MDINNTDMQPDYRRRPYTFDRVVRILFSVCVIIAVIWLLNLLKGVLLPFLVACLISYMLEPVVKWNMRWMHTQRRFIPVVLTLLQACFIIGGLAMLIIPYIASECAEMAVMLRRYATTQINIPYISQEIHSFIRQNLNFEYIYSLFSPETWSDMLRQAISSGWSFLSSSFAFVLGAVSWLIVVLYTIFIMIDYERLMLSFKQLVPHSNRRRVFRIFDDVKNAMNRYFRGQFIIAFLVGILFSLGFYIIGLPLGIILGLFIGMLNMVPYLQLISLPIAAILCMVATAGTGIDFWTIFWETMAVYIIVQCIQDLILTPRIMGKVMGLNPAIILLSLSIWGCLLGFMGLIIALPLTTLLLSYYDQYVLQHMRNKQERRAFQQNINKIDNFPE